MLRPRTFRHHHLIGTVVDVSVLRSRFSEQINNLVKNEMKRLEAVISVYDPASELNRWKRGENFSHSSDFLEVMSAGLKWQIDSNSRFNTSTDSLIKIWRENESKNQLPSSELLGQCSNEIQEPKFTIEKHAIVRTGDVSHINLNAFAKGWIVDRGIAAAREKYKDSDITINAGGDIMHIGLMPIKVGIENPFSPFDNSQPLGVVEIRNLAIATSGMARKGFRIGGLWYSHVLNPLTGWPIDEYASMTVRANNAATADVLATILSTTPREEVLTFAQLNQSACIAVLKDKSTIFSHDFALLPNT